MGGAAFAELTGWNGVLKAMVSSSYFPPVLLGLVAIGLAKNPDGILSLSGEFRARLRRSRLQPTPAVIEAEPRIAAGPATAAAATVTLERDQALVLDGVRAGEPNQLDCWCLVNRY